MARLSDRRYSFGAISVETNDPFVGLLVPFIQTLLGQIAPSIRLFEPFVLISGLHRSRNCVQPNFDTCFELNNDEVNAGGHGEAHMHVYGPAWPVIPDSITDSHGHNSH